MLEQTVDTIKGIGEKAVAELAKMRIKTHKDLLEHYPIRYEYYPETVLPQQCVSGKMTAIRYRIHRLPIPTRNQTGHYISINCGEHYLTLVWFHNPYICRILKEGNEYVFRGMIQENENGSYSMFSPLFYSPEEYEKLQGTFIPVYRQTKNLRTGKIHSAIEQIREEIFDLEDLMNEEDRGNLRILSFKDAVERLHFPVSWCDIQKAQYSIRVMELFGYLSEVKKMKTRKPTVFHCGKFRPLQLPYDLTEGQLETMHQIMEDMNSGTQMRRLVQGDVGSGKTILSFLSMSAMAQNGYQSVLLAPTELLVQQHYAELIKLLESNGMLKRYCPVLLTGSTSKQNKKEVYEKIASGRTRMIVGTHSVLNGNLVFHSLGLVVTDEQHRFGVLQRDKLSETGYAEDINPHILALSATPIPRTMSSVLYGDMDISIVKTKPKGRMPVKNCLITDSKRKIGWKFIEKEIQNGHQAYIVCSMVDENEYELEDVKTYTSKLLEQYPRLRPGILYGSMGAKEKDGIMEAFSKGELDILVSTTVIEVGINVPNATVMMIENAERFGLAQLHQLRGRIGRGSAQSYCIFVQGDGKEECERLRFIAGTNDGFEIAEKDAQLRGMGDLVGTSQSGHKKFKMANLYEDFELVKEINDYLERKDGARK